MKSKAFVVAKTNFRNIRLASVITAVIIACILIQDIVFAILELSHVNIGAGEGFIGIGNYLYLLIILSAIFIPSQNFRKIMNLGGKRADFFGGCAATYVLMAAVVSFANILLYYIYDSLLIWYYDGWTLNVLYWFGWIANGPVIAFFQQFAFLFLLAVVIHTLTAAQDKWYGWVADIAIIAIISVFTPIAPLRSALVWFFHLIIFSNPLLQIFNCLILAAIIYSLNRPILSRKTI